MNFGEKNNANQLKFCYEKRAMEDSKKERNESTKIHLCKSKNLFQNCILKFYEKFA